MRIILATAAVLMLPALVDGQTSYPMITHTTPVAVQRGKTMDVTVEGQQNFFGVYKVLFDRGGLSAEVVPDPKGKGAERPMVRSVKLRLTVAEDAPPGVHEFRLASALGISSVGQLVVVDDPVVGEVGDNNTLAKANALQPPCVVSGRIEAAEDVDYFKLAARAGETYTIEVLGARLQDKIHDLQKHADPLVALFDAEGREVAANDDFFFADPLLTYTIPKDGNYLVQIRDAKYDGDARWAYALHVTNRPHVTHVYPMAGNPGQNLEVEPVGSAKALQPKVSVPVPSEPGPAQVRLKVKGMQTNPTALIISSLPQILEEEPNDDPAKATRVTLPCGINGRAGVKRDLDHFVFTAQKGRAVRFEVKARRFGTILQSSLDSQLDVLDLKGRVLMSNDDVLGKDASLVFTPPADGDYVLRLRDLNSKGGDTFVYHVEADLAGPDFTLRCDPDKAMMGPGSSNAWFVHVTRANGFTGSVQVAVRDLPAGVTVNPLTIPPSMTQGLLVLTAAPDAKIDAANVQVIGTATVKLPEGKEETLTRQATANSEIYLPGGGRGRFDVNMQTVAITEPSDIMKVDVTPKEIVLKPGEEVRIEVTLERRKDYDKSVTLDVLLRHLGGIHGNPLPPGVTMVEDGGKSKTAVGTGNKGFITLRAAPDAAPIDNVPVSVLAHVSINFVVKVSYSSPPILLSIRK